MRWVALVLSIFCSLCQASDFLPAWQAFQLSARAESSVAIWLDFNIADEYHIYQNKIKITPDQASNVRLGEPVFPDPIILKDKDIGEFKVYEHKTSIRIPVTDAGNGVLKLKVNYQGCKGLDLCYPEQSATLDVHLANFSGKLDNQQIDSSKRDNQSAGIFAADNSSEKIASYFQNSPFVVIASFFVLGLLIAFTPCVFPLLPVLAGVIAGNNISTKRSFFLAFCYIVGGAVSYSVGGVIAATFGYNLSVFLQNTWVISVIAILFMTFALSLFGAFELQLPAGLQNKINNRLNKYNSHSLFGAFLIGAISTLILSPCVTAPLAGALVYISSTGNVWLGGSSLFAMGMGSGLPLMLIAVFGKRLLPKAGLWMLLVKKLLGMIMLLMAIYMLGRIIPEMYSHILYLAWGIALIYIIAHGIHKRELLKYSLASIVSILVLAIAVNLGYFHHVEQDSRFTVVDNQIDLLHILQSAEYEHQPVMLDFYASWCIACKEMDLKTFNDAKVNQLMSQFKLVRVDVSENNQNSQSLLEKYKVLAPPSIVFVNKNGKVLDDYQITGFISNDSLYLNLKNILTDKLQLEGCIDKKC